MRSLSFMFRCLCAAAVFAACFGASGQTPPAEKKPPRAASQPATSESPPPAAIPIADVGRRAEETSAMLNDVREGVSEDRTVTEVEQELSVLAREIGARLAENRRTIARSSSIETLRRIERRWAPLRRNLAGLSRQLGRRQNQLDHDIAQVDDLAKAWQFTLDQSKTSAPPEVQRRMQDLLAEIGRVRAAAAAQHAQVLAIEGRVAAQDGRLADALTAVRSAREIVEETLFDRDSQPIWSSEMRLRAAEGFAADVRTSIVSQGVALRAYAQRQSVRFLLHAVVVAALTAALYWLRGRVHQWLKDEPALAESAEIFEVPLAAALLLSILGGIRIYPDAPILLLALLGALALIPATIILRRLIERPLYPVLYALIVFYFVDQVRLVAAPLQLLPRLLLLAEMLAAGVFAAWLAAYARRRGAGADDARARRVGRVVKGSSYVALAFSLSSFIATAVGYSALGNLLGNALLSTAYVGLMLYALVELLDGLFLIALHLPPAALLGSVKRHRTLLTQRFRRATAWLAFAALILYALDRLELRARLFRVAADVLGAESSIGSLHLSLGDVLAFSISIWAAFLVSRLLRFLLEEDVYTRFNLRRGLPYAISTMLNYTILVVGFFMGVAALGFDMTKFTILAGAFSIGVGFGLQNIFNNFVSGLILLFERPVKVGDAIQLDDATGVVQHIGIRASTVLTSDGSEIIVPNSKLISERVVNWTFSGHERTIHLPIAVPIGTDLNRVIQTLEQTARNHPGIAKEPPPKALVTRMGPDWLGLDLRAWTEHVGQWMEIRSDLAVASATALASEKIPVR